MVIARLRPTHGLPVDHDPRFKNLSSRRFGRFIHWKPSFRRLDIFEVLLKLTRKKIWDCKKLLISTRYLINLSFLIPFYFFSNQIIIWTSFVIIILTTLYFGFTMFFSSSFQYLVKNIDGLFSGQGILRKLRGMMRWKSFQCTSI